MCNRILKPLIAQLKKQDMRSFPLVYEVFKKLIKLYAARLGYEDAVSELTLCLIEVVCGMDLSRFESDDSFGIQKYIAVCLRNRYIVLSMKKCEYEKCTVPIYDNVAAKKEKTDEVIMLNQAFNLLNQRQKEVLIYKYIYGYSDVELSKMYGISRQAVNGLKIRALAILRNFFIK